jgi:Nuclease-related domain
MGARGAQQFTSDGQTAVTLVGGHLWVGQAPAPSAKVTSGTWCRPFSIAQCPRMRSASGWDAGRSATSARRSRCTWRSGRGAQLGRPADRPGLPHGGRPRPDTQAWQRGADGERHLARLLEPLVQQGWGVEHDLPVRGAEGNLSHVVIGPPGIFAIDTRHYRGRLRVSRDGLLWHGRTFLLPSLSATRSKADLLQDRIGAPDVALVPIVAVLGAMVPGGQATSMGVTVVPARRRRGCCAACPRP